MIYEKYTEAFRYLVVGVLTTIVSLSTYYFCVLAFLDPRNSLQLQVANVISWVVAVSFAYFMSRRYVFQSIRKMWIGEAIAFYGSRLLTLFLDMMIMFVMVTLCGVSDKLAKLVVQVVVTVANYVLSKVLVFGNHH